MKSVSNKNTGSAPTWLKLNENLRSHTLRQTKAGMSALPLYLDRFPLLSVWVFQLTPVPLLSSVSPTFQYLLRILQYVHWEMTLFISFIISIQGLIFPLRPCLKLSDTTQEIRFHLSQCNLWKVSICILCTYPMDYFKM